MKLGQLFCTSGIQQLVQEKKLKVKDIVAAVSRFEKNDFGLLCEEDKILQDEIIKNGYTNQMLLGIFMCNNIKFWIINEETGQKHITTILLPSEY
ncbi:hypothetical protein [Clostridium sp.]|uniref:hypothetical protein n=1 Tax=Clostridium sp. TaxID=1506 RepID=UPI003F7D2E2E